MNSVSNFVADSKIIITNESLEKDKQDQIVQQALRILYSSMQQRSVFFSGSRSAQNYLELKLLGRPNEVFACLYLDSKHFLIEYRELFYGTIDGATVYPRVVVQEAMRYNAAAVIFRPFYSLRQ